MQIALLLLLRLRLILLLPAAGSAATVAEAPAADQVAGEEAVAETGFH